MKSVTASLDWAESQFFNGESAEQSPSETTYRTVFLPMPRWSSTSNFGVYRYRGLGTHGRLRFQRYCSHERFAPRPDSASNFVADNWVTLRRLASATIAFDEWCSEWIRQSSTRNQIVLGSARCSCDSRHAGEPRVRVPVCRKYHVQFAGTFECDLSLTRNRFEPPVMSRLRLPAESPVRGHAGKQ